ncbi:MAG: hypothetical protein JWR60_1599 [Polaromonas sp.]|nr:hypothetical protein [Polaromonas sp.]
MKHHAGKPGNPPQRIAAVMALAGLAALAGCTGLTTGGGSSSAAVATAYRCAQGMPFTVRFVDNTAVLQSQRGDDVLLRDAGGQGTQTVYSNARLRAEFGLGADGRQAALHYLGQPLVARCMRD